MFNKIRRWFNRPLNPAGNVYYARLRTPQGTFYKLGFTSKLTLVERLAYGNSGDEKLLDRQFFFSFREDAWDVEQTLLEHFDRHRAFGKFSKDPMKPLCGRGQTELFAHDILGLDEGLYKLPEKATLKAIKDEHEQAGEGCLMILIGLLLIPFTLGFSLLFILGGASGVFGSGRGHQPDLAGPKRPVHPLALQQLINTLNSRVSAT